jgi:hypothetical protein
MHPGYPAISGYRASCGPGWSSRLSGGRACRWRLTRPEVRSWPAKPGGRGWAAAHDGPVSFLAGWAGSGRIPARWCRMAGTGATTPGGIAGTPGPVLSAGRHRAASCRQTARSRGRRLRTPAREVPVTLTRQPRSAAKSPRQSAGDTARARSASSWTALRSANRSRRRGSRSGTAGGCPPGWWSSPRPLPHSRVQDIPVGRAMPSHAHACSLSGCMPVHDMTDGRAVLREKTYAVFPEPRRCTRVLAIGICAYVLTPSAPCTPFDGSAETDFADGLPIRKCVSRQGNCIVPGQGPAGV